MAHFEFDDYTIEEFEPEIPSREIVHEKQPKAYYVYNIYSRIIVVMSGLALIFGFYMFLKQGDFEIIGELAYEIYRAVFRMISNIYNNFFNIQIENNAIIQFLLMMSTNIKNMLEIIIDNITSLFGLIGG